MDIVLQGVVVRHAQGNKGRHWLTLVDEHGEYQFESDEVDLSVIPRAVGVKVTARLAGAVYRGEKGSRQVLKVRELKYSLT